MDPLNQQIVNGVSGAAPPTADVAVAAVRRRVLLGAAGVVVFALLTVLGAQVRVLLPGTPVPMTLQTLFVLLAGITLGPRLGAASMAFYLLLGMAGAPVFAAAVWKDGVFFGPTGGYLIGFVLAQPIIGAALSLRRKRAARLATFAASIAGTTTIFACGLTWLALWLRLDLARTLELGLWPFVVGAMLKIALASAAGLVTIPAWRRLTAV